MRVTKDRKDWESFCPYVGLRAFKKKDSRYFCGRSQEIKRISESLRAFRLTILYGPSGVGKSSVLQAGVVPNLRERKRNIVVYFSGWQSQEAIERLRSSCYKQIWRTPEVPAAEPQRALGSEEEEEDEDVLPLPGPLDQLGRTPRGLIFLILDQFEEYLLASKENPFDAELARVINKENVNVHVLIGIRQEDLSKLDRFRPRIPNLLGNALRLSALTPKGAEEALRLPVKTYNKLCPPEFTIAMGADKENDPVPEIKKRARSSEIGGEAEKGGEIEASFLQLVMTALWEKETNEWKKRNGSGQRQLRLTTLKELGGVSGITQRYLQREMKEQLTRAERLMSGKMFREMVSSTGERISRHKERLIKFAGASEKRVLKVLTILEDRWIVRRIPPASYEVRPALADSVWAWQKSYFQQLRRWIGVGSLVLVAALFAGLYFGYYSPKVSRAQTQVSQTQTYAQVYGEALQNIRPDPGLDPARTIRLATEAIRLEGDPKRRSAAQETLENAMDIAHLPLPPSVPDSFPRGRLYVCETNLKGCTEDYRQNFSFTSVSFSRDEKLLAAAFQNKVRVWDLESGKAFNLPDKDNVSISGISDAVFSPDGNMIGAATDDGNARIWERSSVENGSAWSLKTWGARDSLGHHDGQVWGVAFDPKRPLVATAGEDKTVKIWNLQTGELIHSLNGHTAEVVSVVFSRDGKKMATASRDHNAIIWDVDSWRATRLRDERGSTHTSGVYGVAFSPEGDRLATTGLDGFVKIWDVATGNRLNSFRPGPDTLWGVGFSPDGAWLAVAGRDGVASIWDWRLEKKLFTLLCGAKGLTDLTFSSGGNLLVAGTKQGYVQIWDVAATRIFPKAGQITGATFYRVPAPGRQGKPTKLAVISTDQGVWLRDAAELNPAKRAAENEDKKGSLQQFGDRDRRFTAVAFNPKSDDPGLLAAGDTAGRVQVFSDSGQAIMNAKAGREVGALAFHPSGLYIAIGDRQDAGLRIWDLKAVSKDNNVRMIVGPGERDNPVWLDRIVAVAFSPDGKYLAAGGSAKGTEKDALGEVRIWSFKEPNNPNQVFKAKFCHSVRALDFSLNSQRLAVGCDDGTAAIWDFEKASHPVPLGESGLFSHQSSIYSISFDVHQDLHSDEIATASADGTAKVWDANNGELLGTYYGHSGGVLAAYLYAHDKLATVGTDKTLQCLDLKDLELKGALERARRLAGPDDTSEGASILQSKPAKLCQ